MKKGNTFPFGASARLFIYQADTAGATALQRAVEIIDVEADVMDPGASLGDELANWRVRRFALEEFDERFTGDESGNAGAVRVVERNFREFEDVSIEGEDLFKGADRYADVGDARSASARIRVGLLIPMVVWQG